MPKTGGVSALCSYSERHRGGKAALEQAQAFRIIYVQHPQ